MPAHVVKIAGVLVFAVGLSVATSARVEQTAWTTLAPAGRGFSIQVPGEPSSSSKPDRFVYEADEWAYFVTINPVTDAVRELVVAENQQPIRQYLERIHDSFLRRAKETSRSDADFPGYPSIRFSADIETEDKQRFQGRYWLVVTGEHDYILMAIGTPGVSDASAERFLGSFRLDKAAGPRTAPTWSLASTLKMPMLAVALMITEQRLNPVIDQMLQRSPGAKRAGARWNPTHPAWPKARTSLSGRVAKVAMAYDESGEMDRTLAAAMERIAPGAKADAIMTKLIAPAGPEILREHALIEFVSTVMADDPNGPKAGERAWAEKSKALTKAFDEGLGSVMPRDQAHEAEAGKFFSTPEGDLLRQLWRSVVGKAATEIKGAANLLLFDDLAAISREIEAAIASVK